MTSTAGRTTRPHDFDVGQPLAPGLSADIQFVAGYSFNSLAKSDKNAVRAQVAVPQAVTDIGNSFAWETRLALWREVGPRLGLMVAGRYLHTRPEFTFADGTPLRRQFE
jgi:hypothetical protein